MGLGPPAVWLRWPRWVGGGPGYWFLHLLRARSRVPGLFQPAWNCPQEGRCQKPRPLAGARPGGGSPGASRWPSPGEAGFLLGAFVELVLGSFGKYNECAPPSTLSEEQRDRKGTGQTATASSAWKLCLSGEGTVTQQDHTTAPVPGLLGATVKVDRQTDNAGPCSSPQQPGQDPRRGSGRSTMYTAASRGGRRYLTRFSTEYTDM